MRMQRGFTLIELLIVIAIISVLASVAYSSYNNYLVEARRTDAVSSLSHLAQLQEKYYLDNDQYTIDTDDLGSADTSRDGYYTLTMKSTNTRRNYEMTATAIAEGPQSVDTPCQNLIYKSNGMRTPAECWE